MYWDDIVIGEGNKGNSSVRCHTSTEWHISENNTSYWISNEKLNIGLTVFKYTVEGIKITELLDKQTAATFKDVNEYLALILLKNISIPLFNIMIGRIIEHARQEGKLEKMAEMRSVLGF